MAGKRRKREILNRTDHRLDMSPAGRNLFVSRDKQIQERKVRQLRLGMRVVAICVAVCVAALAAFYMVPWFREELTVLPSSSETSSGAGTPVAEPAEEYDAMGLPVYDDDVCLFAINAGSPVGQWFVPKLETESGVEVDARIVPALRMMVNAAKNDGLSLVFTEGYVSYEEQQKRFDDTVQKLIKEQGFTTVMADAEAKSLQPSPGESDFQSGMCLRLSGNPETFESSRTYTWLKNNMGKYGFIFRYPAYKDAYTGVEANLTVIRYVGGKAAEAMQQRSMCLEEYLDYLDKQ